MEDLSSLVLALDDDQKAVSTLSTSPFGSLFSLPPEIRLMIYEFSCGDIYTDENFKSRDEEIADSYLKRCACCRMHIPETGEEHQKFITKLGKSRRGSRRRAFEFYFNLTLVNKAIHFEARKIIREHYRSQIQGAHQVYYICMIKTSKACAKHPKYNYTIAAHDSWAPRCSTATALAALRLPKLALAFCHGGLTKELGQALQTTNATKSLRIHIEDAAICAREVDFFETKFAWTKQIEDTRIIGRACHFLWTFQADSKLSSIKKEEEQADFPVPFILDSILTGTLKYEPYKMNLFLDWNEWIVDQAQKDHERNSTLKLKCAQRCISGLGGEREEDQEPKVL